MVAKKPKDENSILIDIPISPVFDPPSIDTSDLLGDADSGSAVESFESEDFKTTLDNPDVKGDDSDSETQNADLNVFDPLAETVIADEFFAQLQPTGDQPTERELKPTPPELPPYEQFELYLANFQLAKTNFIAAIDSSASSTTEGDFYNLIGGLIFECFFSFPGVYNFFYEHHKNNRHYYSGIENRQGFLTDFLVSLNYQYELAVDALNDELSQELSKAAYFEASAKQDEIAEVLETLRN